MSKGSEFSDGEPDDDEMLSYPTRRRRVNRPKKTKEDAYTSSVDPEEISMPRSSVRRRKGNQEKHEDGGGQGSRYPYAYSSINLCGEGDATKEEKGKATDFVAKYEKTSVFVVLAFTNIAVICVALYMSATIGELDIRCQKKTSLLNDELVLLRNDLKGKEALIRTAEVRLDKVVGEMRHLQSMVGEEGNLVNTRDISAEKTSENVKQKHFNNTTDLVNKIVGEIKKDIVKFKSRFERIDDTMKQVHEESRMLGTEFAFVVKQVNDTLQILELDQINLEKFIRDTIIRNLFNKEFLFLVLLVFFLVLLILAVLTCKNTLSGRKLGKATTNLQNQVTDAAKASLGAREEIARDESVAIECQQKIPQDETDAKAINEAVAGQEFQQEETDDEAATDEVALDETVTQEFHPEVSKDETVACKSNKKVADENAGQGFQQVVADNEAATDNCCLEIALDRTVAQEAHPEVGEGETLGHRLYREVANESAGLEVQQQITVNEALTYEFSTKL